MSTPTTTSTTGKAVAIVTIVFGALVIVATVVSAGFSTIFSPAAASNATSSQSIATSGVTELVAEASATELTVRFADVREATLDTEGSGAAGWTFERNGSSLKVESPSRSGVSLWFSSGIGSATLTLPENISGLDTTLTLNAGSLNADGDFGDLDLTMNAGSLTVAGSAETVTAVVNAGSAEVNVAAASAIDLSVNAGEFDAEFSGSAPEDVTLAVSAGSLTVGLPDGSYAVSTDVSLGSLTNELTTSPTSRNLVSVTLEAGSVALHPTD
ncbi:hypothetical protein FHX48_000326 [Microbacterium halimionae]|uniref:DUF4097 domain-containing protein n=1 Tax=Microbacterium halimionae TaxID=1526413 RepID=A0A7W3JLW9_9MICO|nr:DUF4097 family beta strand repeat-containing protein [Microbacterium halimionae]MBA8815274.1 hypothetical protein [Microbacterium halimionae]NII93935.1 hypothetical protein [Microbacterium halimionae]